jgi:hypothetical protein
VHTIEIQLRDLYGNNITQGDISSFKVVIRTGSGARSSFVRAESQAQVVERKFPDPATDPAYYAAFEQANPYLLLPSIFYEAEYTTPTAGWTLTPVFTQTVRSVQAGLLAQRRALNW